MIETRTRKRKKTTDLPAPHSRPATSGLNRNLNEFLQSLGEVLIDITALEVNTMVVEQISADKFVAWEAYRDIYPVSLEYLEQQGIHESLRDRYLELRKTLELEYALLLSDPSSEFYDPNVLDSAQEDHSILTDPTLEFHHFQTRLPNPISPSHPEEILRAQRVLRNCRFLRCLRKVRELQVALDNRNQALHRHQAEQPGSVKPEVLRKAVTTDLIFAQTVIQLDGDVINRYAQEILDHPHRDVILHIHKEGVMAGEKQWRGLLEFLVGLVQASLQWSASKPKEER